MRSIKKLLSVSLLAFFLQTIFLLVLGTLGSPDLSLSPVSVSAQTPQTDAFEIQDLKGAPCIFRNGKPVCPIFFWESFPQTWETEEFSKRGMELFSAFRTSQHYEHDWWKEDGSIDYEFFEKGIQTLLKANPNALFLPRVYYTAPEWWVKKNPDELTVYSSGNVTTPRESFASLKFRKEAGEAYRKLIRHILDSDYANHILGIHVASGPWGEHFYWDAYFLGKITMIPQGSDTSRPMQEAFRRFLREKYREDPAALRKAWCDETLTFESASVPTVTERVVTDGAWRDPAKSRKVMDYLECHYQQVTDTIKYFCRIVKEESQRKLLTVVFYGYTQDENWAIEKDHRNPWDLLNCPDVDAYSAPHTYYRRSPGEDGEMRQYAASTALHGRLFIDEGDDQTYLENLKTNPDHRAYAPTPELSKSILQREFGLSATMSTGLWFMDLNGGWFRDHALLDTIGKMRKWAPKTLEMPRNSVAEVAIISQPKSEFFLGYRQTDANRIGYGLYHDQMGEFFRTGAPFDWYLIDDLEELAKRGRDYKAYVFLDCFYLTPEQRAQIERLKAQNHTLIWFYAPGYASDETLSLSRMEELTGFRFQPQEEGLLCGTLTGRAASGTGCVRFGVPLLQKSLFTVRPEPGVEVLGYGVEKRAKDVIYASRELAGWRSVFCSVTGLPANELRRIFREAGIHLYCDSGCVVTANASWLMLHTREAGTHKVHLRAPASVTEIVTEKKIGDGIKEFETEIPDRSTRIFLLEH